MTVSEQERNYMQNLLDIIDGKSPTSATSSPKTLSKPLNESVQLAGPGQVTSADVQAMHNVLSKLEHITDDLVQDPEPNQEFRQALQEQRNTRGISVGSWQIAVHEDAARLAGKQYYSIHHTQTQQVIANDISLYETALGVARLLNKGEIRELFEQDDTYTSHKIDAHRFRIRSRKTRDQHQRQLYETRMQASSDRAQQIREQLKKHLPI
jgi:hypothetical protein